MGLFGINYGPDSLATVSLTVSYLNWLNRIGKHNERLKNDVVIN